MVVTLHCLADVCLIPVRYQPQLLQIFFFFFLLLRPFVHLHGSCLSPAPPPPSHTHTHILLFSRNDLLTCFFFFVFFFIKIGTKTASVSDEITAISKLAEDSLLSTTLHSAGTTIAGPWNEVMDLIGQMHELLHNKHDVLRIQSDIRVGTRVDKLQTPADKIDVVKRKLKALLGTD